MNFVKSHRYGTEAHSVPLCVTEDFQVEHGPPSIKGAVVGPNEQLASGHIAWGCIIIIIISGATNEWWHDWMGFLHLEIFSSGVSNLWNLCPNKDNTKILSLEDVTGFMWKFAQRIEGTDTFTLFKVHAQTQVHA